MVRTFLIVLLIVLICPLTLHAVDIKAYMYPHELSATDVLTDGPTGTPIELTNNTLLIWVDLHPGIRFTHPTTYILISGDGTKTLDGGWWPVLNGKQILYGEQNSVGVISPFGL